MVTVFYNPACSKCRRVRELLDQRGEPYVLTEYLRSPPDRATLESLLEKIDAPASSLVRRDGKFSGLGLHERDLASPERIVELLVEQPELLERPIVVHGERAIVARPPERVAELFDTDRP